MITLFHLLPHLLIFRYRNIEYLNFFHPAMHPMAGIPKGTRSAPFGMPLLVFPVVQSPTAVSPPPGFSYNPKERMPPLACKGGVGLGFGVGSWTT